MNTSDEYLREDKLNLAQKVSKMHLVQQVNKGAPTQEKQKIRWNYRKKKKQPRVNLSICKVDSLLNWWSLILITPALSEDILKELQQPN